MPTTLAAMGWYDARCSVNVSSASWRAAALLEPYSARYRGLHCGEQGEWSEGSRSGDRRDASAGGRCKFGAGGAEVQVSRGASQQRQQQPNSSSHQARLRNFMRPCEVRNSRACGSTASSPAAEGGAAQREPLLRGGRQTGEGLRPPSTHSPTTLKAHGAAAIPSQPQPTQPTRLR